MKEVTKASKYLQMSRLPNIFKCPTPTLPNRQQYDGVLNYYQGYHDVVTVLLLVTGDTQLAYALTERASHYFFR